MTFKFFRQQNSSSSFFPFLADLPGSVPRSFETMHTGDNNYHKNGRKKNVFTKKLLKVLQVVNKLSTLVLNQSATATFIVAICPVKT